MNLDELTEEVRVNEKANKIAYKYLTKRVEFLEIGVKKKLEEKFNKLVVQLNKIEQKLDG